MVNGPLNFNDTEIAFKPLSNGELRRAYWLFKIIGNKAVVGLGPSLTEMALKLHLPIKTIVKKTVFAHFCGGETIKECLPRIEFLAQYNVGTILDFAKEGEGKEADFDAVEAEIMRTIEAAATHPQIPFAVFKPTGVGSTELLTKKDSGARLTPEESAAFERVRKRFENICALAAARNVRVMIDAEETWFQDTIDELAHEMMGRFNKRRAIVFNTVQMYRHDRLAFLRKAYKAAEAGNYHLGIKLVRGAYIEKENKRAAEAGYPTPMQPTKAATDADYNEALAFTVSHIDRMAICAGTHNDHSVRLLTELMANAGLAASDKRIFFAQLLGMSDNLSFNLAANGYNVAKYVPYGTVPELLPYLTRRAQENSSVLGQTGRELSLLMQEKKRRGM